MTGVERDFFRSSIPALLAQVRSATAGCSGPCPVRFLRLYRGDFTAFLSSLLQWLTTSTAKMWSLSGLVDISVSILFKYSLIYSSPTAGEFVLTFLLAAGEELLKAVFSNQHNKSMVSHLSFVDDALVEFFFCFFSHALPDSAPGCPSFS